MSRAIKASTRRDTMAIVPRKSFLESRCFFRAGRPEAGPPTEAVLERVRSALDHVGHEAAERRRELEGVAAIATGNHEARPAGIARNPEMAVARIAVEADAGMDDGR